MTSNESVLRSSDSSSNNRGENARIKKNRPRQTNPISRSDAMDEANELSAVIYSISRFFSVLVTFPFSIVSNLRKFQKLFFYSYYTNPFRRGVE